MALKPLGNAIPAAAMERPKKPAGKIVSSPASLKSPHASAIPMVNDENSLPVTVAENVGEQTVEYIASGDLEAFPEPEAKIENLLVEMESKNWIRACEALNDARRIALHHSSLLLPILEKVMQVIVKSLKSPRSALCKTSIMACIDIFHTFGHLLLSNSEEKAFDQLLLQLLLKASQDKRFVCEEATKALESMTTSIAPVLLLKKLKNYVNHKNLRIRAKAAVAISKCVSKMGLEVMNEFGMASLLQVAAELLNDRLPEAREAARNTISSIYAGFLGGISSEDCSESWQNFCLENLPPISVQSVVKIVSQ